MIATEMGQITLGQVTLATDTIHDLEIFDI